MKSLKTIFNVLAISIILFFILNFVLGKVWELRTHYKFKNFKPYDDVVLKALNLNEQDALTLYLETFIDRKFEYEQFTEHAENNGYENKFVNVTPDLGRKTLTPSNCDQNIFFYGGSTTFGYNVTDEQTISSYLGKYFIEEGIKICVKNYGRGSYFSTQENILFQKHILNSKISSNDIIVFIDGINENGNRNSRNTEYLFQANKIINEKYWDMYKQTFSVFFNSLAINQFILRLKKKLNLKINKTNNLTQQNIFDIADDAKDVFQKNIYFREGICEKLKLNCFTFLQPFATLHGVYFKKIPSGAIENRPLNIDENKKLKNKFELIKDTNGIIDISNSLINEIELSYVDGVHYSPEANKKIAFSINDIIKEFYEK